MLNLRTSGVALAALLGSTMLVGHASAMPLNAAVPAAEQAVGGIQDVRYVCGPYRCWWTPGPYWGRPYYGYVGPRPHYWHRRCCW